MAGGGSDMTSSSGTSSREAFYRRLLELGNQIEIESLLDEALSLIVEVTGATTAYLELYDDDGSDRPRFWRGHRCSDEDLESIRQSISRGIIARAISEGRTIESTSARGDPRFQELHSVQRNEIGAVLCAPIGAPPIGVVYLQDRARPGSFGPIDREHAELFARQLAQVADRILARQPANTVVDHTREIRERFKCEGLIGRSRAMARVLHSASLVAPLDVDVLITGPNGTGKTALAQAIAGNGARRGQPFIVVNCGAIQEALVESELFGAERGAHSTATHKMIGKVAAAEGGTLFLDELGDLALASQVKLLHLLQAREYHPLGAAKPVRADIRVICATNKNLRAEVAAHRFREDLYYRVHVLPIEMPGLAERRDDIPELVDYFCRRICARHGFPQITASRRAIHACREAPWSGHIRELENRLVAALIHANDERASILQPHHIWRERERDDRADAPVSYHEATRQFQRRFVLEALERNHWNVADTARELELARSYVYNLIQELGLKRPS
ncbi:MAG TPA: sigma-54-dependent Fis family transcriptional regulator [Kofleriaceae bacterium]|nr:sigma-54-dependent Fis family transcriptional regulator [Kofleriaceae bacterium]